MVVCCEVGSFVYVLVLALRVDLPLALICEVGKLPSPTVSVFKSMSHISSSISNDIEGNRIEMEQNLILSGALVVVVDDVLATGKTFCVVLDLLDKANVGAKDVSILVVAEFSIHCGRELLCQRGYGGVDV
ncbi:unnamed protein product [Penicillium salamii]|uniref:adenine phosphoribosyltransferase n=1 Tax=Penicillium salamii TaxID=1612424 RepID=A0A9W4NR41_9EURO|nr:unnamed protein product [Penicillium salamii]CAG8062063.1 unnamed protein product [Penicillium salamii]CAG8182027.1 unnamed protein product [Penicillium salamii]CAG8213799.1 unnamed protein product [Penicillium salamii]CAG8248609.1 unnamed protein product [Penicillium salamii]